jgi:hypothetical protein
MTVRTFPERAHVALLLIDFKMLLQKVPVFMISNFASIITTLLLEKLGITTIKMRVHVASVVEI